MDRKISIYLYIYMTSKVDEDVSKMYGQGHK